MIQFLVAAVTIGLAAVYVGVRPGWRRSGPYLPDSFVAGLAIFAIGAVINAFEMDTDAATEVATMGCLAACSGLVGAIIGCGWSRKRDFRTYLTECRQNVRPLDRWTIVVGLGLSSAVCVWFIHAVMSSGAISALLSIGSLMSDSTSLTTARKMITAGTEGYFAPGYVKQFRDILVPVLLSAMIAVHGRLPRSIFFWGVAVIALAAMLLTGQRSILLVYVATLMLASHYVIGLSRRVLVATGITTFAVLGVVTVLLGRTAEGFGGPLESAGAAAESIVERIFVAAPHENTITHPVWRPVGPTMGESWLDDFAGLSSKSTTRLSNRLHAEAGGSEEGNSPLALPVDIWLAWGWVGLMIVPLSYALCLSTLDRLLVARNSVLLFGLKMYLVFVVPLFYSPYLFVLYGGAVTVALLALVFVSRGMTRRRKGTHRLAFRPVPR